MAIDWWLRRWRRRRRTSDGIKWIGQGVNGGLVEAEIFTKMNVGENYSAFTFTPRFSFKPLWTTSVGISIPFMTHRGEVQYRTNQAPLDRTTGGIGDLSLDVSQIVGSGGAANLSLALTIPTGQYDIKRGNGRFAGVSPYGISERLWCLFGGARLELFA